MKKISLLLGIGLLCISLSSLAGEVITNDTGEDATGLRVVFSEAVQITAFGDTLMEVDQTGPADEFAFSGGTVSPWGSHWMNWTPSAAQIVSHEWLTGSTATLQGLPAEQVSEQPIVTGNLLNPAYFAHPAYVMQGISERDAVFAMPLDGVEELTFYPIVDGVDLEDVTWSVEVSHPGGIGASIEGNTLYIWGSNTSWAGYGEVTLEAVLGEAVSSVTIPVTVFREDKTLTNSDGKKDYFVPWSPELDINRIISVEKHMRKYNKDEGNLDRSIQWSRWKKMVFRYDIDLADIWLNELRSNGDWPQSTQFALVDVFLSDLKHLGVDAIRANNAYCIATAESTEIYPNNYWNYFTLTKRPEEEAYVINEAHRLGMTVTTGNMVEIESETHWEELYAASPTPVEEFFGNLETLNSSSLDRWTQLGVDMVDLCPAVSSMNKYDNTYQQAVQLNVGIVQLVRSARETYSGPLMHGAHYTADFFPGESILKAPFWKEFDAIGMSGWGIKLTDNAAPTTEELVNGWRALIAKYFQPFQQRFNKPFLMTESGCLAAAGCARYGLICSRMPGYDALQPSLKDMEEYYRSQNEAFEEMHGYYGPGWYRYPLHPYHRGGVRETITATPRLKIEDTIQEICSGYIVPRIIQIDGKSSDWLDTYVAGTDPAGDSRGNDDIVTLSYVSDQDYLYFGVGYAGSPDNPAWAVMEIDTSGDGQPNANLLMNNIWTSIHDWAGYLYNGGRAEGPQIGFADAIDAGKMIELRIARRFLLDYLVGPCFRVRATHFTKDWALEDKTDWVTLWGVPQAPLSSAFQLLDCGEVEGSEARVISGTKSVVGEYDGSGSYTPYIRTDPGHLPLAQQGQYQVCFDYRILETNPEGFEVLFFSPTGAGESNWVPSLRLHGTDGKSGCGCLEAQLHNYTDYEIRWNVVKTGKIVIDNVVVRDLETNQIIAEEDFEDWK